jgi:hypothetical protein
MEKMPAPVALGQIVAMGSAIVVLGKTGMKPEMDEIPIVGMAEASGRGTMVTVNSGKSVDADGGGLLLPSRSLVTVS